MADAWFDMTHMLWVGETVKSIFGQDPSKGVNPKEAIAIGASIQDGVLAGNFIDICLLYITKYTLGWGKHEEHVLAGSIERCQPQ